MNPKSEHMKKQLP